MVPSPAPSRRPASGACMPREVEAHRRALWTLLGISVVALSATCAALGFSLSVSSLLPLLATNLGLLLGSAVLRRRGWLRLSACIDLTSLLALITAAIIMLTCALAATNQPLQDGFLIGLDRTIGFDWRASLAAFTAMPALMVVLNYAYVSFGYQLALLVPLLFALGLERDAGRFTLAWSIGLLLTAAIFPFMPALGGFLHFGIRPDEAPAVWVRASWLYVDVFHAARDGSLRVLDLGQLDGIVTFPSFHAAAAVLFAWAVWRVPWLRWPMAVWNGLMLISAIPIGAHYLSDVLAGAGLAVACILAATAIERYMLPSAGKARVTPLSGLSPGSATS